MSLALKRLCAERIRHKQNPIIRSRSALQFLSGKGRSSWMGDREARPERGIEAFIKNDAQLKSENPRLFREKTGYSIAFDRTGRT